MTLLAVLFWLVVAAVTVVAAALVLPVGVRLETILEGSVRWQISVQPLGAIGPRFRLRKPRAAGTGATEKTPKRKRKRRRPSNPRRLLKAGLRLLTDLFGVIRMHGMSIDMAFGCDDPADTGQIYGIMTPFLYGANGLPRTSLHVEPLFDRSALEGRATLELSFVPIALVPPALRFGWAMYGPAR